MCVVGRGLQQFVASISAFVNRERAIGGALQSVLEVEGRGRGEQVLHHHHHHHHGQGAKSQCCWVASSAGAGPPSGGDVWFPSTSFCTNKLKLKPAAK